MRPLIATILIALYIIVGIVFAYGDTYRPRCTEGGPNSTALCVDPVKIHPLKIVKDIIAWPYLLFLSK